MNPTRQSLASSRKRVLRGEERSSLRSVGSECPGRAIEPRKLPAGVFALVSRGDHADAPQLAWRARSRRGRRTGPRHTRGPWEPGRPIRLHGDFRHGNRNTNSREPTTVRRRSLGLNLRRYGGIAKRRQRSPAKGTDGSRSASYYRGSRGTIPRDPAEGRGRRVTRPLEGNMAGASKPVDVSTKRQRIAELARQSPEMGFTSLAHHIDIDWLTEAFDRTRKD